MSKLQIILICLIPLYALILFFPLCILVDYIQRISKAKACLQTENFLKGPNFGLTNCFCGQIGAGKTTCASAVTNVLSKIKQEQAISKIEEIPKKLNDIDFNYINKFITLAFLEIHITNADAIMNFLLEHKKDLLEKVNNRFYYNYLFPISYTSLLTDYIDAYLAIIRNRYCYYNRGRFCCWTTSNWSMKYDPSMINIKDRYLNNDYKIQRYTTIFEDEKILSGKKSTNFQKIASEDSGGDEFFRLIRHFGKSTIHYIATAQDFNRIVKQERELFTGIFYIDKRKEIITNSLLDILITISIDLLSRWQIVFINFKEAIRKYKLDKYKKRLNLYRSLLSKINNLDRYNELLYKEDLTLEDKKEICQLLNIKRYKSKKDYKKQILKKLNELEKLKIYNFKIEENLEDKIDKLSDDSSYKVNKFNKMIGKLTHIQEKLFAESYISYKGVYYTNPNDVDSTNPSSKVINLQLCFPISYAYGSIDTYSFSIWNDYLLAKSINQADYYDPNDDYMPEDSKEDFEKMVDVLFTKDSER